MPWTVEEMPSQAGKLAVITGASGGLGLETAKVLAAKGADIIVAARDAPKGEAAAVEIGQAARFEPLDLADRAAIDAFVARQLEVGRPIDLLINNAGLAAPPKRLMTKDGFEIQFGVNFLGHFVLNALLLPILQKAPAPRVITVSSIMHKHARMDFDDLMSERRYSPVRSYSQSKLATLIYARELQRRSDAHHWGVLSVAAHPGIARTELTKARPGQPVSSGNRLFDRVSPLFAGTALDGALPTIYAATAPEVTPGGYYGPQGLGEIKGPTGPAKSSFLSMDLGVAKRLWTAAERLTGVDFG